MKDTNSSIDVDRQLITIFLVQHASWSDEGKKIQPTFEKAAIEGFGAGKK